MQQPHERTFGAYNIADLRDRARSRLPRGIYDYLERGAEDEIGLAANRAAACAPKLLPRIGRDVSRIDTRTTLFGHDIALPLAIAAQACRG